MAVERGGKGSQKSYKKMPHLGDLKNNKKGRKELEVGVFGS